MPRTRMSKILPGYLRPRVLARIPGGACAAAVGVRTESVDGTSDRGWEAPASGTPPVAVFSKATLLCTEARHSADWAEGRRYIALGGD